MLGVTFGSGMKGNNPCATGLIANPAFWRLFPGMGSPLFGLTN